MEVHSKTLRCMTVGTLIALVVVDVVVEGRTKAKGAGVVLVASVREGWEL